MPIIDLKISGPEDSQIPHALAMAITSCTKACLNKKPEVTAITVTFVDDALWFVNGEPLIKSSKRSFYLSIKITEKTVSKKQKENYLNAINTLMHSTLNNLHEASYVYVAEVISDAYGYAGETMENRFRTSNKS